MLFLKLHFHSRDQIFQIPPHCIPAQFGSARLLALPNRVPRPFLCLRALRTMDPTSIANFTATVSIFYAYMEAMMDQRIQTMETIAGATAKILQQCGRSPHVASLFTLWSTTSNDALWLAERALFPDLPSETALHLALPPDPRPLAACLDSTFEPYARRVEPALEALHVFRHWFSDHYDSTLHKDTYDMLSDAVLLFQTIDALLALKTQINSTEERPPASTEGTTAVGSGDPLL